VIRLHLDDPSLILMVGPAGSGKSTLAGRLFAADEIISSDTLRERLSGDAADQTVSGTAFALLHRIVRRRLAAGRRTVVDATNLRPHHRRPLLQMARAVSVPVAAIALDLPRDIVLARDAARRRVVGSATIDRQLAWLRETIDRDALVGEGVGSTVILRSASDVDSLVIEPGADPI
jgi:protein phosphatase